MSESYVTSVRDERLARTGGAVLRPTLTQDGNITTGPKSSRLVLVCHKSPSVSTLFVKNKISRFLYVSKMRVTGRAA